MLRFERVCSRVLRISLMLSLSYETIEAARSTWAADDSEGLLQAHEPLLHWRKDRAIRGHTLRRPQKPAYEYRRHVEAIDCSCQRTEAILQASQHTHQDAVSL